MTMTSTLPLAKVAAAGTATRAGGRPSFSVVVCAFTEDRWADLSRAIGSVRDQAEQPQEIILVIDHCPGLLERAAREFAGVQVVANRHGQGLSGARNTGMALAAGDVVAFLDDDAAADSGWLARLADRYADPRVLGVGGLVRPEWDAGRPDWFPPELDWVVGCSYRGLPADGGPVRNFIGANMSFRRSVLAEVGGFSTALGRVGSVPLGCEETELCLRVSQRYADGVLLYEPAAAVGHRVRKQRATWRYVRSRCYSEGISKARVASLAGRQRALSAERSYLLSAISRGVGRSLADAGKGRLAGLGSALILLVAVAWAGAGYVVGSLAGGRTVRRAAAALVPWAALATGLALWWSAVTATDVGRVATSGLGLVTALPVTFWAALGILVASFGWALARQPGRWPVLGGHLVALTVILHATPAIVYGTLRYSWSWKHVGVTDYIAHHGVNFHLGGILGAYQGWPGFFALNAFLSKAAGFHSALAYASWALVVNDLLWLGPVILIARAFTGNQRMIWTAAWLFELGNWVGQDYFSPQAFAFFLYLTVIAVCLRWLWRPGRAAPGGAVGSGLAERGRPELSRAGRWALLACLLPLMLAIASSHQLTPFMLITALALLAVFGQLRYPLVLLGMAVATTVGWLGYGALPWLSANSYQIFAGLGVPWANTSAHLVGGGAVPIDQTFVNWGARLLSAGIGMLAVAGFIRFRRHHGTAGRRSWRRIALLGAAAFPAAAANSYGGEIIFRVFLFALPFLAVAAAAAFFPHPAAGEDVPAGPAGAGRACPGQARQGPAGAGECRPRRHLGAACGRVQPGQLRQGGDELLHPGRGRRLAMALPDGAAWRPGGGGQQQLPLGVRPLQLVQLHVPGHPDEPRRPGAAGSGDGHDQHHGGGRRAGLVPHPHQEPVRGDQPDRGVAAGHVRPSRPRPSGVGAFPHRLQQRRRHDSGAEPMTGLAAYLRSSRIVMPSLLIVSGWLVLGITAVGAFQAIRPLAVFVFALAGPGTALVRLLPVRERLERAVLAVAVSLSLATLAAEAAYIGHVLRPAVVLAGLATVCTAAAAAELTRGVRATCLTRSPSCSTTPSRPTRRPGSRGSRSARPPSRPIWTPCAPAGGSPSPSRSTPTACTGASACRTGRC
jgi:GT2 family glycosyltransferase